MLSFGRCRLRGLRTRFERMFALFVEFVLQSETLIVCLGGANGFNSEGNPIVHVPLAEFSGGGRTVAGGADWKPAVPPRPGVHTVRQIRTPLVHARCSSRALNLSRPSRWSHGGAR